MKAGDIALVSLPQSDKQIKKRPILLHKRMPGYSDWLVCGISTQLHQYIAGFDEKIDQHHPDYKISGLFAPSIVRLSFLSIVPSIDIQGSIGNLRYSTVQKIVNNLIEYLKDEN